MTMDMMDCHAIWTRAVERGCKKLRFLVFLFKKPKKPKSPILKKVFELFVRKP